MPNKTDTKKTGGRTFTGVVVSDKMNKTRVVKVDSFAKHPKYGKFLKTSKKFKAHDEANATHTGDTVTIIECRPISRDKHFLISKS
ncbi:MAG TPA: 30S ribosomal protein S17 [Candidatus Paceibacterota bacterium]|nr:30S ribosomal protein S17 [Candidatus Paceibacterota bacterium]